LKAGDYGTITTPNYPENYPGGRSCEWYLEVVNIFIQTQSLLALMYAIFL
jgi:hypothetical protein